MTSIEFFVIIYKTVKRFYKRFMKIEYLGHSCFLIDGSFSVVTDPFNNIGYDMRRVSADYCLLSHSHFDHSASQFVSGAKVVSSLADVASAKDISLSATVTFHDAFCGAKRGKNLVYKFVIDDICFCHTGDLGEDYSDATADAIGGCDVLMIPVGGNYTIDYRTAKRFADRISPALFVPMHFKTPRSTIDIDGSENFRSLFGTVVNAGKSYEFDTNTLKSLDKGTLLIFDVKDY